MQTDGQLYKGDNMSGPPPAAQIREPVTHKLSAPRDELIILGLILLLMTDKKSADMPLLLALIYILF